MARPVTREPEQTTCTIAVTQFPSADSLFGTEDATKGPDTGQETDQGAGVLSQWPSCPLDCKEGIAVEATTSNHKSLTSAG